MKRNGYLKSAILAGASVLAIVGTAHASDFDIPGGDLKTALDAYMKQARVALMYPDDDLKGVRTNGAHGELTAAAALSNILHGTGFVTQQESGAIAVVRAHNGQQAPAERLTQGTPVRLAAAASAGVETVVVTSSKIKGDIQTVPIAITALSQEQLTARQIAGGPDLVKEVPNLTFSKTNFTGYNIQIRGIGTQAISVTTDPAVAVAFNDIPFIRNHFFEQEFYDVSQVEVLRGPQGTLYGRNATAGVVNVISAKPTDQFESMLSADWGNFHNRRYEGMVNFPIADDRLDIRLAGEWTKRDGYSFNSVTGTPIDGRDLWSSRLTIGWKPADRVQTYVIWEHFQEEDDRIRSSKQLCKNDPGPDEIDGVSMGTIGFDNKRSYLSQGCLPASMYSPDAFEVPNGYSLPYLSVLFYLDLLDRNVNPYESQTQSRDLRVIESTLNPTYRARNDTFEFNLDYQITPALTLTSQSAYNRDFLWSTEDYNRFSTSTGIFQSPQSPGGGPNSGSYNGAITPDGYFCDPQLGCSNRVVAEDLSEEHAWQLGQEFRLASNFSGPFNFSFGGNYLHYETNENYYVFINAITLFLAGGSIGGQGNVPVWNPGVSDNSSCLLHGRFSGNGGGWFQYADPTQGSSTLSCRYIDPNPITNLNNKGHNYYLNQNPYVLNSYAGFGEAYYNVSSDLKLTGGLRWTSDSKHFLEIPSWIAADGYGYPVTGVVDQKWDQITGRAVANWTPKLDFTDQTLIYGSFGHGYKAGGANPPGAVFIGDDVDQHVHPLTFRPEFIDSYELGTKNTLLDGALTMNGDVFYYNYKDYQISEIVDRTAINLNFDATVKGAELEASLEPIPGLKFSFAGGYEDARLAEGSKSVDLMDRTAGHPGWHVVKPYIGEASNCILPDSVIVNRGLATIGNNISACSQAYVFHLDPVTYLPYVPNPTTRCQDASITTGTCDNTMPLNIPGYTGFNPDDPAINGGNGFDKDIGGNELPNAPHFTTSLTAEYTLPVSEDWAATLHGDFYWQSQSFARIFNDRPYDKIRGYSNVNLALILTGADGWQAIGYLKNVFDTTAITGAFLNSDDTALTTNVFLTDPRLFGVRVTKNF